MASSYEIPEGVIEAIRSDPSVTKVAIIKDIGDFEQVITVRAEEFTLKVQIPRPTADDLTPSVSFQSPRLSPGALKAAGSRLQEIAAAHKGQSGFLPALFAHTKEAVCDVPVSSEAGGAAVRAKKTVAKKKKQRGQESDNAKAKSTKKPSMKTAEDVVKRVLWDEAISQEDITIGYIDRFLGLQEKPFVAFSWEDLASIDYFTFAIPKHRIQYFKYKREVIWDKSTRMDNVFGSAGSSRTIQDVIAEYREEDHLQEQPASSAVASVLTPSRPAPSQKASAAALAGLNLEDNFDAYGRSDSEEEALADDDSDDGVVVIVDDDKQSEIYSQSDDEEPEEDCGAMAFKETPYWMDKIRPNFFLCVRVTAPEIQEAVERVQKVVVEREPLYGSCCVAPCMLHVTLCTLRLNNAEEVSQCLAVLRKFADEFRQFLPSEPLRLGGLDRFFHRVLYTNARHGPDFLRFVDHICTVLRSEGIRLMDHHDFVPHMTVMKVSRPVSRQMGTKYISPHVFEGMQDTSFGEQPIHSLYLCSMEKERGPDGFYMSPGNLTFVREVL